MKLSAEGGQAKPVAANATGFNTWKFTMTKKIKLVFALGLTLAFCGTVQAGPPLPLHTIEGNSGVFITSTAYLANPPEAGQTFGKPSFSTSAVWGREKDLQSFAITENIMGKFEIGYAYERFG